MKATTRFAMAAALAAGLAACAARPPVPTTPEQRAQVVTIVLEGGTVEDVAAHLGVSDVEARRVVRSTAHQLLHWVRGS